MNKQLIVLIFLSCFGMRAFADTLGPQEIIPRFYTLLIQDENPSPENEREFFGGNECDPVRAMLKTEGKSSLSQTPIWDYLRSRREWFITKDCHNMEKINPQISSPFTLKRFKQGTITNETRVLVILPARMTGPHTFDGVATVVFTLGKKCYLEIDSTVLRGDLELLAGRLYHNRSSKE